MATYHDLNMEWSALCQDCPDCWTKSDLQLAAELGKTLLERNKELESTLKQYQNVIDDQTQEIEYLTKQTVALREVNDSRLRIYEQLEVSIQDLERANHRLAVDNATDKKQIKVLTTQIETLETKCDELQATVDELRVEIEAHRRKAQRAQVESETIDKNATSTPKPSKPTKPIDDNTLIDDGYYGRATYNNEDECDSTLVNVTESIKTQSASTNTSIRECDKCAKETNAEEVTQLLAQLKETRSQIARDQKRITELQEQIETYDQRTQSLEKELFKFRREDEAKNMQEELITLEEVRQGQICSRCLRTVDSPKTDDMSSIACDEPEEDDNSSMMEALCNQSQFRSSFAMDVQDYPKTPPRNLYKEFVEKYEALVEISCNSNLKHNSHINSGHTTASKTDNNEHSCPSLQEELRLSNDFRSASVKDTDDESGHGGDAGLNDADNNKNGASNKKRAGKIVPLPAQTPTDFSEAETSSSGFSDETSNKATQTDMQPGSFLCTIVDGAESISIYDDASPIESRFRNRPEYRELFKEIFTVLKKAAVNKDEDEELPKLDDNAQPVASTPKVPPVTPSTEPFPDFPDSQADDTQSVLSSTISELSLGHFDPPTLVDETLVAAKEETDGGEIMIQSNGNQAQERVLKPLVRQPLEYISVAVSRKRSSSRKKRQFADRSDSPVTHIVGSPKITYSNRPSSGRSRRREYKSLPNGGVVEMDHATTWNGNTLQFWSSNNRNVASPTPRRTMTPTTASVTCRYENGLEFKPSAASQDLYKLKRLDLSYAEVLRNGDVKKKKNEQNRFRRK